MMQKVLSPEHKIDWDKEHFRIVGLDADSHILLIELVVLGGVISATVKPMARCATFPWTILFRNNTIRIK